MTDPLLTLVAEALAKTYAACNNGLLRYELSELAQAALSVIREQEQPTEAMFEAGARQLYRDFEETDNDAHVEAVFTAPERKGCANEMREWFGNAYAAMQAARPLPAPPLEKRS